MIVSFCLIEPIIIQCWKLIEDIREVRQAIYIFLGMRQSGLWYTRKHMSMKAIAKAKSVEINGSVNQYTLDGCVPFCS